MRYAVNIVVKIGNEYEATLPWKSTLRGREKLVEKFGGPDIHSDINDAHHLANSVLNGMKRETITHVEVIEYQP